MENERNLFFCQLSGNFIYKLESSMSYRIITIKLFSALMLLVICLSCTGNQSGLRAKFTRIDAGLLTSRTYATASATWVDADNDGDADLYVVNGYGAMEEEIIPNPNFFYRNNGDGTFTSVDEHPLAKGLTTSGNSTWADYDNDGDLDVFIANQRDENNELYMAGPDGTYDRITTGAMVNDGGKSFSSVWVDMNNDGWVDLHVLNGGLSRDPQPDFVYRNNGDGTFERLDNIALAVNSLISAGAAWGDYDHDGDMDVIIPLIDYTAHPIFRNDGNWVFSDVTEEIALSVLPLTFNPAGEVAAWVDIDNDLDLDLFRGAAGGYIDFLYLNDGSGQFKKAAGGAIGTESISSSDAAWGDFDNDGDIDMVSS
ncbi:MAG: VCBS repeat-containing protein, partial [Calditrichia bacterium]